MSYVIRPARPAELDAAPFNRSFYERAGFSLVPEESCGPGIRHHLAEQRASLPLPDQRIAMRRPL